MKMLKITALAPLLFMFTACVDSIALSENTSDQDVLAQKIPSNEEIAETMIESSLFHLHESELFGITPEGSCRSGVTPPDPVKKGVVTLTFDDGPSSATTSIVLDVLAKYKIKATFFMLGSRASSSPSMVSRVVRDGHIIANHSTSHPNFRTLSSANARRQIEVSDRVLSPYMTGAKYFRYPYGNSTCTGNAILTENGYQIPIGWHVDSCDWALTDNYASAKEVKACGGPVGPRSVVNHTLSMVDRMGGGIVLFHDIHANTARNLETIIVALIKRGYTFTNLSDTQAYPKLNSNRGS